MKPRTRGIVYLVIGTLLFVVAISQFAAGTGTPQGDASDLGRRAGIFLFPVLFLWRGIANLNAKTHGT